MSVINDMADEEIENEPFEIPEQLLNQVNECCDGGFLLFCFGEDGEPNVYMNPNMTTKDSMAIQKHIRIWLDVSEKVQENLAIKQMTSEIKRQK